MHEREVRGVKAGFRFRYPTKSLERGRVLKSTAATMGVDDTHSSPRGGELNAALTRALVRRNAEFTGRGPSKARVFYSSNVVVVILENAMTSAERSLAANGKADLVLQVRREVQLAMKAELVALVEKLSDCRVSAFLSDTSIDPDLACEVFVLDRPVPA